MAEPPFIKIEQSKLGDKAAMFVAFLGYITALGVVIADKFPELVT